MKENFTQNLPARFVRNTLDVCGETGEQWLSDLPDIIAETERKWSLKVKETFSNLSYNFVAPCVCDDGREAVLKIALPLNKPEIFNEAAFLQIADGSGAVKLLNFDKKNRAILLEKLTPGKYLKEICTYDETVEIAIKVMRRIHKKPPENSTFLSLEDWFNGFERAENTTFDKKFSSRALEYFEKLNSDSKNKLLLHGDLHHENILSARRESFLTIDPKGIVGNIGYEISVFLNNHALWLESEPDLPKMLNRTVHNFSQAFEIEPEDLCRWAFAQMVLSARWTFEENGKDWKNDLHLAQVWEKIGIL